MNIGVEMVQLAESIQWLSIPTVPSPGVSPTDQIIETRLREWGPGRRLPLDQGPG
jgi:hypothetical protein